MRTQRELYTEKRTVYHYELDQCPQCGQPLKTAYTSGWKTVQKMSAIVAIAQCPKRCRKPACPENNRLLRSTRWQQIAPLSCTYGYEVIVQIGWQRQIQRQTFSEIHLDLSKRMQISETQTRAIYNYRYLPLLACQERLQMEQLKTIAHPDGLWLSLDGLAPEGGEAQLWIVREIRSGHTLRCGWMSQQDQGAFVNFLQPIVKLGLPVSAVMSGKQRGLVPAIAEVFSDARHLFCQTHYLSNAAEPLSAADEAMKITLRQGVRQAVGTLIRQEKVENQGVLTVTGGIPSPITPARAVLAQPGAAPQSSPAPTKPASLSPEQIEDAILQDLSRRIRYLLALKGRPPFCLAGVEMFERLTEVKDCLERLNLRRAHPQLEQLQQGLNAALQMVKTDYALLRQAADWLKRLTGLSAKTNRDVRANRFGKLCWLT